MIHIRRFFLIVCILWAAVLEAKPVPIILWHSLAGHLGVEFLNLIKQFNNEQQAFIIQPVYKGEYTETLTSFAAAFQAKQPPAIVQVFEVGITSLLKPKGIIKPVSRLFIEQKLKLPTKNFFLGVKNFYSEDKKLMAMPFNTSVPVIFYNQDALSQLGYARFPSTWQEFEILAHKLKQVGFSCAYTTAYPAWIQIESFSAIHNLPLIDSKKGTAVFNNKAVINHLKRLRNWQQQHLFEYGGRASDATILFTSGRCPVLSQSSGSYKSLTQLVKFHVGVAPMPLDLSVSERRHNNVIGGAALWAVSSQNELTNKGIAQFFFFLARPDVQAFWHINTGYLPLGLTGVYSKIAKKNNPILNIAEMDLMNETDKIKENHLSPYHLIREINDKTLEAIFAGMKTPKQAIDDAVKESNYAILRFRRNTDKS